jgi:hypothetical protein
VIDDIHFGRSLRLLGLEFVIAPDGLDELFGIHETGKVAAVQFETDCAFRLDFAEFGEGAAQDRVALRAARPTDFCWLAISWGWIRARRCRLPPSGSGEDASWRS